MEESLALARKARDGNEIAFAIWQFGRSASFQGDYEHAIPFLEEALTIYRAIKNPGGVSFLLGDLGKAALLKGDPRQAIVYYKELLALHWNSGNERNNAFGLEQLANVAVAQPQPKRAARLFGAADAVREASGVALYPYQVQDYENNLEALSPQLDEAAFAARWAEGRAMSMQQAVAYALQEAE